MEGLGDNALIAMMDAIGIDLSGQSWKAAHLKKSLSGVVPVEHFSLEGEMPERFEKLKAYMKKKRLGPDSIALALPPGDCLVKIFSLPSADRKALSGMLGFEIERHIPAESDAWRWSHSVVKTEGTSSVLMFSAVKAAEADVVVAMFEQAGLKAAFVTSGQEAFSKAAMRSGFLPSGPLSAIASVNGKGFSLDFFKNGMLAYSSQAAHGTACREIGFALSFLKEMPEAFIVMDEDGSEEAAEALKGEALGVCGLVQVLGPLPALSRAFGAALMAFDNRAGSSSLLEKGQRSGSRGKVMGAAAAAMLAVFAAGAVVTVNDALTIRKTEKELALLGDDRIRAQSLMKEVEAMTTDIKTLEELKGANSPGFLDMLRRLTELTPEDTYLTGLEYGKESISVDGVSQKASGLFMKLSRSGLADEIRYDGPVVRGQDGRERFKIRFKPTGEQGNADDRLDS